MTNPTNYNDRVTRRNLGGGYIYEWELGVEIAMLALLHEFSGDWSCAKTDVPIPADLRLWLGDVREIKFEATQGPSEILEDVNLYGSQNRRLHIQMKSGSNTLGSKEVLKAIERFLIEEKNPNNHRRRYLIVSETGASHRLHKSQSVADLLEAKSGDKAAKLKAEMKQLTKDAPSDFLSRVRVVKGPSIQRVLDKNLLLTSRLHSHNCGRPTERRTVLTRRDALAKRFGQLATTRELILTPERLRQEIDTPTTLAELAMGEGLDLPDSHPLNALNDILRWDLGNLGYPSLKELLNASLSSATIPTSEIELELREAATSINFPSFAWAAKDGAHRNLLALRRIIALGQGELADDRLREMAQDGQEEARVICWLALGTRFERHGVHLVVRIHQLPLGQDSVEKRCRSLFTDLARFIDDDLIQKIHVRATLPEKTPEWLTNNGQQAVFPTPPDVEGKEEEDPTLQATIRSQAERLKFLKSEDKAPREQLSELRKIYEFCREHKALALLINVAEDLANCLRKLKQEQEATTILLSVAKEKAVQSDGRMFFQSHSQDFKKLQVGDGLLWQEHQVLLALFASRRANFAELEQIAEGLDVDNSTILNPEHHEQIFEFRLIQARAACIHCDFGKAQSHLLSLYYRLDRTWEQARCRTLLLLVHAAFKSLDPQARATVVTLCEAELRTLSENNDLEYQLLAIHLVSLKWILARTEESVNEAFQSWNQLHVDVQDDITWAIFQNTRTDLEFRKGVFRGDLEISRRAAVDIRKLKSGGAEALRKAREAIANRSLKAALDETYLALDLSLVENDWGLLQEAQQTLTQVWLAGDEIARAVYFFTRWGAPLGDNQTLGKITEKTTEEVLEDVFDELLAPISPPAQQRAWTYLLGVHQLLTTAQRGLLLKRGRESLKTKPVFQEDNFAQTALFKLLAKLFRCPSHHEESITLLNLFLDRLNASNDQFARLETLQSLRSGFWSSTGHPPVREAAGEFLKQLETFLTKTDDTSEREIIFDIILSLGINTNETEQNDFAHKILRDHNASASLAEWDARTSEPSLKAIQKALTVFQRQAKKRISRGLRTAEEHLGSDSLTTLSPFLKHLTTAQSSVVLKTLVETGTDSHTPTTLRWDVIQLLRHPVFQNVPNDELAPARKLLFDVLEGGSPENLLDRHRKRLNASAFSGWKFDVEHENRVQKTTCEALGTFHANASTPETLRYFRALIRTADPTDTKSLSNVAQSLVAFFQSEGSSDLPELQILLYKLLAHPSSNVRARGFKALGEKVHNEKTLEPSFQALIESASLEPSPDLELRKGLAIFSRLALRLPSEHPHWDFIRDLNQRYYRDPNPIVKRLADVSFWTGRKVG